MRLVEHTVSPSADDDGCVNATEECAVVRWTVSASDSGPGRNEESADPGLFVLDMMLRLRSLDTDPKQLRECVGKSSSDVLTPEQACGCVGINGLLWVVRRRKLKVRLLDLRSSGDTAGDKAHVVGYGAFAVYEDSHAKSS